MAKHCGQLRMLALDGNCSLTDKGVLALAENCPCLSELYLLGSDRVSQHAVQHVVVSTNLYVFSLNSTHCTAVAVCGTQVLLGYLVCSVASTSNAVGLIRTKLEDIWKIVFIIISKLSQNS